ncbi:MATE family efflux transporter [Saccharibacillus sp. VR-M41]|uniref:MATE family efflux transporter n=2 Tax=Saccharibacillus alkalitolerans TaxID=2705290 RepID=A0ABX0F8M1_9BACL|nr:MATE family efflux transporter [Saccharibacillus alkalitolerans]NGZ76735.1 MATE family efflux transporter [Saccharibacillus alkalitolerans]
MQVKNGTAPTRLPLEKEFNLFRLTWPIFLEVFLFMLMGIVDTLVLSAVSDDAVAAVGAANQVISIAILILEVVGNGAAIVIAQYIGARNHYEAARISGLSITLNLMLGVLMSGIFLIFGQHLMTMLNLHGDILVYANSYLAIVGGAIFLQALINMLSATIRTYGQTKATMFVALGMNALNLAGNYLLVFGHLGFPQLGVQGSALATVISRAVAVFFLVWMLYQVMEVRIQFKFYLNLSREYIMKILKIGIPSALEQITYQSCQMIFFFYATFLGAQALAARQYATNISMFIYLFAVAVAIGTGIIVGRLVGANRKEDAYHQVWSSVKRAIVITVVVDLVVILLRHPLVGIFTEDADVIRMATQVLVLSIVLETARTFNMIVIGSLRAAGDAKFPVYVGLVSMVGISLPLGYVLVFQFNMGLPGIWLAIAADEWIRVAIMYMRWKSRVWKKHSLVQHDEPEQGENLVPPAAPSV